MRPSTALTCALTCSAALVAGVANAQPGAGPGGAISITSDYVYRGISITAGNPAIQGDLHYQTRNGWVLGVWGSESDPPEDKGLPSEADVYLGHTWMIDPDWQLQATLTHYTYPNDPRPASYDYDELVASVGFRSRVFGTIAWSPNLSRRSSTGWVDNADAVSYEVTAVQPLTGEIAASAGVGFYDLPDAIDADYWFWNVGLACAIGHLQLAFSYIDTDDAARQAFGYANTGERWTGSVAWRF